MCGGCAEESEHAELGDAGQQRQLGPGALESHQPTPFAQSHGVDSRGLRARSYVAPQARKPKRNRPPLLYHADRSSPPPRLRSPRRVTAVDCSHVSVVVRAAPVSTIRADCVERPVASVPKWVMMLAIGASARPCSENRGAWDRQEGSSGK